MYQAAEVRRAVLRLDFKSMVILAAAFFSPLIFETVLFVCQCVSELRLVTSVPLCWHSLSAFGRWLWNLFPLPHFCRFLTNVLAIAAPLSLFGTVVCCHLSCENFLKLEHKLVMSDFLKADRDSSTLWMLFVYTLSVVSVCGDENVIHVSDITLTFVLYLTYCVSAL